MVRKTDCPIAREIKAENSMLRNLWVAVALVVALNIGFWMYSAWIFERDILEEALTGAAVGIGCALLGCLLGWFLNFSR